MSSFGFPEPRPCGVLARLRSPWMSARAVMAPVVLSFLVSATARADNFPLTLDPALDRFPDVSNDGSLVVFSSLRSGKSDLWVIPLSGGKAVQLTDVEHATDPAWSPMGDMVAFARRDAENTDIWIATYPEGELFQVTSHPALDFHPAWAPDGRSIAFHSNISGQTQIWSIDLASRALTQITTGPGPNEAPEWSPNGRRMVYWSNRSGNADIYVLDVVDGKEYQLTHDPAGDRDPAFSPTGNRIVFHSNRANEGLGSNDLYIYSLGVITRITFFDSAHEEFADWAPGERIVYQTNIGGDRDIWVLDLRPPLPTKDISWGGVKSYFRP